MPRPSVEALSGEREAPRAVLLARERRRRWREKNPDYMRQYRADHPEKWIFPLTEAQRESKRRWDRKNRRLKNAQRRTRERRAGGFSTATDVAARMSFWGYRCWRCGGPFEHVDHVIPLARGGTNWPANLRPSCAHCNLSAGGRL